MLARRLALLVGVLLCVAGGGLVLGGASAFALNEHLFSGSFGGSGASALSGPSGVAVNDETGDVYVVDKGHNRVEEFNSTGSTLLGEFDGAAAGHALSAPEGIAVDNSGSPLDPSAGDVYVVDTGHSVIDKFSSAGTYLGQLTETTGGASFGELDGVAVDAAGVVWVYQGSGEIDSFSDALGNEYLSQRFTPFVARPGFAVDGEDDLYVRREAPVFAKLNSAGEVLIEVVDGEASSAAAVDFSSGEVFIDEVHTVGVFSSGGSFLERFGSEQGVEHLQGGSGIAVAPGGGTVYVADAIANVVDVFTVVVVPDVATGSASGVQPTSATLNGTVNPDGIALSECSFEYGASTAYGQSVPCVPAAGSIPADSSEHAVSADLTGLAPGSTYHFRLRAGNAGGANFGEDATLETPPPPSIENAAASNLTGSSVDLSARIDPRGAQTVYRFEYGSTTAYGASVPVPDGTIAAVEGPQTVSAHVTGLQLGATYHWRVVAQNASGAVTGDDHTFVYATAGEGLPDNRGYEMVTPPRKNGALVSPSFGFHDIAEDGSRVIANALQCFAGSSACNADRLAQLGDPFVFTRSSGGWVARALAPAATQYESSAAALFSAGADTALFIAPAANGYDSFYAREADDSLLDIGPEVSEASGVRSPVTYEASVATADLSHVVYEELVDTVPNWSFDGSRVGEHFFSLYEYVGGGNSAPSLVGVSGGAGSTDLIGVCGTRYPVGPGGAPRYNPMSADGRVVLFTVHPCDSGSGANAGVEVPAYELYARIDQSRTVLISARSPLDCTGGCLSSTPQSTEFQGASTDGSKVFFTSRQRLTNDASEGAENLYEYDFSRPAGDNLVDVSAGDTSGGGPGVTGVEAVSSDGSHIYFAATGVLTSGANSQGQLPRAGAENLYMYERDGAAAAGRIAFIATLPPSDVSFAGLVGGGVGFAGSVGLANVTPDGRYLVFLSHGRLVSGDEHDPSFAQVYRYDAQTGALIRISVGENGFNDNGNAGGDALIVPAAQGFNHAGSARPDPTMSHDGSFVFFESPAALTPHALNDVPVGTIGGQQRYAENVYEWHAGHVYLISDGRDTSALSAPGALAGPTEGISSVRLLGSDATGANVFFRTADRLVGQDTDTQVDFYDARVCTVSEPCTPGSPVVVGGCVGEACRGVPGAAPGFAAAVSSTFAGIGNVAAASASTKAKAKPKPSKHRKRRAGKRRRRAKRAARRLSRSTSRSKR